MEDIDVSSLEVAKSSFLSLLSRVNPCESAGFVEWVIQQCSNVDTTESTGEKASYTSMTSAEKKLKKIIKEIKKRVPLQGIMASENISHPEQREVKYSDPVCLSRLWSSVDQYPQLIPWISLTLRRSEFACLNSLLPNPGSALDPPSIDTLLILHPHLG